MSQDFKLKFDEMRGGVPTENKEFAGSDMQGEFSSPGNVRNLCFIWPDGRMKFLNYAYLVSCEYEPDEGRIIAIFTSCTISLKGNHLGKLFEKLFHHIPQKVAQIEPRYISVKASEYLITEITVESTI